MKHNELTKGYPCIRISRAFVGGSKGIAGAAILPHRRRTYRRGRRHRPKRGLTFANPLTDRLALADSPLLCSK
jgi:hypothetical protein